MSPEFCFFHPRKAGLSPVPTTLNHRAIKTILSAIQLAWQELETFEYLKSSTLSEKHLEDEDELSVKLKEILNSKLQDNAIPGFAREKFQDVVRDGKQSTADNESIDQMPDLTFRMVEARSGEDREEAALYVEAKLLEKSFGCSKYVINGLHRFVTGKYAPQVTFGLMLGYATHDFSDASKELGAYFGCATSPQAAACKADVIPSRISDSCFESNHRRNSPCPPEFCALHLWLVRPKSAKAAL